MTAKLPMRGAGGILGGSAGSSSTQTPDNLRSLDTVEVVLGLCEGPIYGLENGNESFYIGETVLQAPDGTYNFGSFTLNFFPGDDVAQPVIPHLTGTASNNEVGVLLVHEAPVVRQTSIKNLNFIDVRIVWTQLYGTDSGGSTYNANSYFTIEYKLLTATNWNLLYNQTIVINGKTTSTYAKIFRIPVPPNPTTDYEIRVTKLDLENSLYYYNGITWESYQEVITTPIAYNDTALLQFVGQATDQFTSIPEWSGIYKGRLIQVPSNYNPITKVYTGIWDGSWQITWSDNPAWILYDFVMNNRYGVASYFPEVILDKYSTYTAAQWCDGMVSDGAGGLQARYTFNALISEESSGILLAQYIAGTFNATFFDDFNGTAYIRCDKDDPADHIFTKENIYDSGFEYAYTDITTRYNDITVTYINPDLNWKQDRRRIYNQDLINQYGRIPYDFIAVGCTNENEAMRKAFYQLITVNTETCIVNFKTNRLGSLVCPFDIILICDPDMGYGISGRIKSISQDLTTITLRDPVYLESGISYLITLTLEDNTKYQTQINNPTTGNNYTFTFNSALPNNISYKAFFTLESSSTIGTPRPFRVTKIEEGASIDEYTIEAISINRNKWYDADNLVNTGTVSYSTLPSVMFPPGPTTCSFLNTFNSTLVQFEVVVSPVFDRSAYKYYAADGSFEVWSRPSGSNDSFVQRTLYYGDTLFNHPPGEYEFRILGVSYLGTKTSLTQTNSFYFNVTNPKDPPADVDFIGINDTNLFWGYSNPPADFAGFQVRYSNVLSNTVWAYGINLTDGLITNTSIQTNLIPVSAKVIMVRAVDAFGNTSVNSAILLNPFSSVDPQNIINSTSFSPAFAGTITNGSVNGSGYLVANDTGNTMYSGVGTAPFYKGQPTDDFYDITYLEMTYTDTINVTVSARFTPTVNVTATGFELNYKLSTSSIWLPVPNGQVLPVGLYDIQLIVYGGNIQGVVQNFSYVLDTPTIEEDFVDLTVPSTGLRLPITKTYSTIKVVYCSILSTSGSTVIGYKVLDKQNTIGAGPLIKLYDTSGNPIAGYIDATVKGF